MPFNGTYCVIFKLGVVLVVVGAPGLVVVGAPWRVVATIVVLPMIVVTARVRAIARLVIVAVLVVGPIIVSTFVCRVVVASGMVVAPVAFLVRGVVIVTSRVVFAAGTIACMLGIVGGIHLYRLEG